VLPYFATAGDQALSGRSVQAERLEGVYSRRGQTGYRAPKYKSVEELSTRFGQRVAFDRCDKRGNAGQW
jgi:hypothetical protein